MAPRILAFDSTLTFLRRGYLTGTELCDRMAADAVRARLLGRKVTIVRGASAARMFYAPGHFTRQGAMPTSATHLLQDVGSVQALDGQGHRHREAAFLKAVPQHDMSGIADTFRTHWRDAVGRWSRIPRIRLLPEVGAVLTRTAVEWAGIPLEDTDIRARTRELTAMISNAGTVGPANWWARLLRRRSEAWAASCVRAHRNGRTPAPPDSPLAVLSAHHDPNSGPLPDETVAIELLNVLRPLVAVGRFITFCAVALHRYPQWRSRFASGDEADLRNFVQEVRRLFPFFPLIGGRVLDEFEWDGIAFRPHDWVVLDLYGTNHDPRLWDDPEEFRPERFREWDGDPNTLVPQGGGDVITGHRCPGENVTIGLMVEAMRLLTREMTYIVPPQDMSISLRVVPAAPRDGFVIADVGPAVASTTISTEQGVEHE